MIWLVIGLFRQFKSHVAPGCGLLLLLVALNIGPLFSVIAPDISALNRYCRRSRAFLRPSRLIHLIPFAILFILLNVYPRIMASVRISPDSIQELFRLIQKAE
jgi:hypothetical protein